jgi:hypothetical protein
MGWAQALLLLSLFLIACVPILSSLNYLLIFFVELSIMLWYYVMFVLAMRHGDLWLLWWIINYGFMAIYNMELIILHGYMVIHEMEFLNYYLYLRLSRWIGGWYDFHKLKLSQILHFVSILSLMILLMSLWYSLSYPYVLCICIQMQFYVMHTCRGSLFLF